MTLPFSIWNVFWYQTYTVPCFYGKLFCFVLGGNLFEKICMQKEQPFPEEVSFSMYTSSYKIPDSYSIHYHIFVHFQFSKVCILPMQLFI